MANFYRHPGVIRLTILAGCLSLLVGSVVAPIAAWAERAATAEPSDESEMLARARAERTTDGREWGEVIRERTIEAEATRRVEEAERDAELDELTARLGRQRHRPHPGHVPPPPADTDGSHDVGSEHAATTDLPPPPTTAVGSVPTRATILLVMTPGDRGIRRMNPSADPIICLSGTCWISRGPTAHAKPMRQAKAFGPMNTLGSRAGACNDNTRCVFRNVEIGAPSAVVQPIDLRLLRHDRRAPLRVSIDFACRIVGNGLDCGPPQRGVDYVLWVVPEAIVAAAGQKNLERFLEQGALRASSRMAGELRTR